MNGLRKESRVQLLHKWIQLCWLSSIPRSAAGGSGLGQSSPSEAWVVAAPLSINSLYHGCSQHGPTLCQAFPSPHTGSAEVMTCVPSTVILALSGSAHGSGISHCPEAKPDQCWEKKPFLYHLHQHTRAQTGVKQKLKQSERGKRELASSTKLFPETGEGMFLHISVPPSSFSGKP